MRQRLRAPVEFGVLPAALAIGVLGLAPACADPDPGGACTRAEALVGGTRTSSAAWKNVLWHDGGCSALLLSERVVVFPAHCGRPSRFVQSTRLELDLDEDAGTLTTVGIGGGRSLEVADCATHPDGEDLGYCTLADAETGTLTVPAMLPCERSQVGAGEVATLVGFGFGGDDDPEPGVRRVGRAPIRVAEYSIIIGDAETGSCRGDSGGPAFVQLRSAESGDPVWRVLGILSFGREGACGAGDYLDLSRAIPWLEASSGHDLTPCGTAEGDFRSGPTCIAPALNASGEPVSKEPTPIRTCPRSAAAAQACPLYGKP